jgi:hypothetical protein
MFPGGHSAYAGLLRYSVFMSVPAVPNLTHFHTKISRLPDVCDLIGLPMKTYKRNDGKSLRLPSFSGTSLIKASP